MFSEVFLGKLMLETEEKKIYLFMDKEENALRISEFISKSLDDCLEEGELQELEKWRTSAIGSCLLCGVRPS